MLSYFKTQPASSLYYDLPKRTDSSPKIRQMIDLFKKLLVEANHQDDDAYGYYSNSTVKSFGSQILKLMAYEDPKNGYKIFIENWEYFFDACFEIFTKSTRNDSRDGIYRIDLREIYKKSKFKDHKRLGVYLCEKLLECVRFLNSNWKQIDEKTVGKDAKNNSKNSCLEYFYDFSRPYVEFIVYEVKDIKGCGKLCIDLLAELSQLVSQSTDYLHVMEELLYKENFYVLKDYSKVRRTI